MKRTAPPKFFGGEPFPWGAFASARSALCRHHPDSHASTTRGQAEAIT